MLDLAAKLVEPARILIVVGMALTLASTGWFFVVGPDPIQLADAPAAKSAPRFETVAIDTIAGMNLFGRPSAGAPVVGRSDAPETSLRLQLLGVFQADEPEESAAIIAETGRPAELFTVGNRIPGNAELVEVYTDRVVIRRGGLYETLRFDEAAPLMSVDDDIDESLLPGADPPQAIDDDAQSADASSPESIGDLVERHRTALESDPDGTLNSLGLSAVSDNEAKGYRLGAVARSPYLSQTGLQPGDVIISVNGRPVGNVSEDRLEIDNIVAQGSARLEVQRGSRRFFVTTSLR